ncbi:MAG: hypothetical protein ACRCZP_10210, partial [Phycicoccus sp.]
RRRRVGAYPAGSLSRSLVALALHSGITPDRWLAMGDQAIHTALHLLSDDAGRDERAQARYSDIPLSG